MKVPGLLGTISIVAGLVLAIPMGIIGFEFLSRGEPVLGVAFLGLAVAVLFLPEFVIRRLPRPRKAIRRRIGRLRSGK